jgi:hypothetical protein
MTLAVHAILNESMVPMLQSLSEVVLVPAQYKSGDVIYPYEMAK